MKIEPSSLQGRELHDFFSSAVVPRPIAFISTVDAMVDENIAEAMNRAAAAYPPEIDEIKEVGLTAVQSDMVKSPRIAEAPISMECRLIQTLELGNKPTRSTIILGEVLMVHINDEVITQGKIDPRKAKIIARLGDNDIYCRTTDVFKMKRL